MEKTAQQKPTNSNRGKAMKYEPGTPIETSHKGQPIQLIAVGTEIIHGYNLQIKPLEQAAQAKQPEPTILMDKEGNFYASNWPTLDNLEPVKTNLTKERQESLQRVWQDYWLAKTALHLKGSGNEALNGILRIIERKQAELQELRQKEQALKQEADKDRKTLAKAEASLQAIRRRADNIMRLLLSLKDEAEQEAQDSPR